jgi:hypothetical protein
VETAIDRRRRIAKESFMSDRKRQGIMGALLVCAVCAAGALAQSIVDEKFNTVTGTGGGPFVTDGTGFNTIAGWDTGITGEGAFAGAIGFGVVGEASALGTPTGGVAGSGAGIIEVTGVEFNNIGEDFEAATGTGGGNFVTNAGAANTSTNWDSGITGETAFAGPTGGAALGTAVAEAVLDAGVGGSKAGRITVQNTALNGGNWYAGLNWTTPLPTGKPVNTSFEEVTPTGGDRPVGYFAWGNAWAVAANAGQGLVPRTGNRLLKMWGNWSGTWNTSAVGQNFLSQPGDVWEIECWVKHINGDNLVGTGNFVLLQIEFINEAGTRVGVQEVSVLNSSTPVDEWIHVTPFQGTAPAGTAKAQCIVMFLQPNFQGGAAQVEDLSFRRVTGPPALDLNSLYLTANVQGNAVSGQNLGSYVLKLEDGDGDALQFTTTANGGFQTVGGQLSTAATAAPDAQHPNANGLFDRDSSAYNVTLAFANPAASWGTGGQLTIDNLKLSSGSAADSGWYAGLYWESLVAPPAFNPAQVVLAADVKGSVPGGAYQVRVEGFRNQQVANVNESFTTATVTGGGKVLDASSTETSFYLANWDDGISGEEAYGGIYGSGTEICDPSFCPDSGFTVQAVASGGHPGAAGQIKVDSIIYSPGDGWYAGLRWPNQVLPPAPDLSQISMTADILGTPMEGTSDYGEYELRIEDSQNDRLYFHMTANGSWQSVGGPLSTATEGPALDGGGDGVFDVDSPPFAVVVAFANEVDTWYFGGTLTVDNLFLTSGAVRREIGRVSFEGVANGSFQSVGGMLQDGITPQRVELDENFATATGTGGGEFYNSNGGGYVATYDTGIPNAEAFAGSWNNPMMTTGGVSATTCASCGVGGTPASVLDIYGIYPDANSNGWWAGLSYVDLHPVLVDLTAVSLTASVKGLADANQGESYGTYQVRIEDPDLDFLAFTVTANGTWQNVGGPLSTAVSGKAGNGNSILDTNADWYHIVVTMNGQGDNWGSGGTLIVDDVKLDGLTLANADSFNVVVTFDDEVATWGSAGRLTVDNLLLTTARNPDCNGDNDVDLMDYAVMQACFGGSMSPHCACADVDNDGDIDLADHRLFSVQFEGP